MSLQNQNTELSPHRPCVAFVELRLIGVHLCNTSSRWNCGIIRQNGFRDMARLDCVAFVENWRLAIGVSAGPAHLRWSLSDPQLRDLLGNSIHLCVLHALVLALLGSLGIEACAGGKRRRVEG